MRISKVIAIALISLAVLPLCACTGVVRLAHGDPSRAGEAAHAQVQPATAGPATPAATSTTTPAATAAAPDMASAAISAVNVIFSDQVRQQAAADPRMTPQAISMAVQDELQAHQMFAPGLGVNRTLTITVQDFSSTLASNVTVLGYTFRNLLLIGSVQVPESPSVARPSFTVRAHARLSNRSASASAGSLDGLFGRFAVLAVAELRSVPAPAEALPR